MTRNKYLVIGDAILDHYIYGQVNRMSPEDPQTPVLDISGEEYRLGGCLNVSANLKSLSGEKVYVASIISNRCKKMLDVRSINHQYSYHLTEVDGIKKTRAINTLTQKQIVRLDNLQQFDNELIEEFLLLVKCIDFDEFDCIVVSDYKKGIITDFISRKLKPFKKPVFVDTKNPNLSMWDLVDQCFIKMNDKEWTKTDKKTYHNVIVTEGEKGAKHILPPPTRRPTIFHPIEKPITNGDVTGAGDVFLAGLVTKYMKSKDLKKSIEYANWAARKSVQQKGTVEVYP